MKLSPIENKSKNKTRKETKTYNTGFVCGLLVFGDLSAFPQSQENTHTTFSLLSRRAWWFGWELSPQAQTLEHTVPSGRRCSRRMEVQPSWRKYVTGGGLWEFKSQTTSGSLSLLLPAGIWGCALPLPVSMTVPALPQAAIPLSTHSMTNSYTSGPLSQDELTLPIVADAYGVVSQ